MNSVIEKEVLAEFKHIAKPMMDMGLYDSTREFVRDVTRDFIRHKIETYRMKLKDFEQKYHMTFTDFSKKLKKGLKKKYFLIVELNSFGGLFLA